MPDAGLIVMGLNIFLIGFLILGFLVGVMKGFYKSIYHLFVSLLFFIIGVIIIIFISKSLLDVNMPFLKFIVPDDANIQVTSIRETLPLILSHSLPDQAALFVDGTDTMALVYGVVELGINLVLLIVLFVLNATIFKLIRWIVWLFIRPKRDALTGEKPKKHRLLGGLVEFVKIAAAMLLFAIPVSGIFSMATAAQPAIEVFMADQNDANLNNDYIVTFSSDDDLMDGLFDIFGSYEKSLMGKIYGIGNLDKNLFDLVFKINVKNDETDEKLYLRRDVVKAANIADILLKANDDSTDFDTSYLFKLTEEDLTNVQREITGMTIINVLKNIGAEFGYDLMEREGLIEGYEDEISLALLKSIDLNKEINTLIDAVKIINESENQEEIFENVFSLTQEEATSLFNKLAELQVIETGLPVAFNILLNMPETIQTMEENNINPEDITRPTQEELISDFKNIVNIYNLAKDMGFEQTDDFQNLDIEFALEIEDVHVNELFLIVFNFSFLYNNDELFANLVYDFVFEALDEEFKDVLSRETLVNNFNAGELTSIGLLGKLLFTEGLFSEDEGLDFVHLLREENVDKISGYISGSNILSDGTEGLLNVFTSDSDFIEIVVPTNYSFKGSSGKAEIESILHSFRNIFEIGMFDEGFDFATIPDEKIEELALNFSNSDIIRYNLSPLINQLTAETDFAFIRSDEDESFWTQDEIYYTFKAVKIFASEEISEMNAHTISDDDIFEITKSQTISNAIALFLAHENEPDGMLNEALYIKEGLTYHSTETEKGEIYYFFRGLKEIIGDDDMEGFGVEMSEVLDMDIELIFESKILEATIIENHLRCMCIEEVLGKYIAESYENGDDFDWYKDEVPTNLEGDAIPLVRALADLDQLGITYGTMNYFSFLDVLTNNPNGAQEINDYVLSSKVLNASLPKMLEEMINTEGGLDLEVYSHYNKEDLPYWGRVGEQGEFFYILDALLVADEIKDFDYTSLNNTNKEGFKANTKKIARSETLRQMLPKILEESNLTMADDLRSDVDPRTLTEQEWNTEIDVLVDILVLLNENSTLDFDNPNPAHIPVILEISTLMADSILYDETKIIL